MRIKTVSIFGLLIAASLIAAGASGCGGGGSEPTATPTTPPATSTPTPSSTEPTQPSGELVEVFHGQDPYVFIPDTFDLELGKTYTLDFNVPTELHTFTLPELGIDIFINAGEKVTEDITINQAGEFELICTPHLTLGMVGTVTVS